VNGESDLDQLRHDHPGWDFAPVWITCASGPDARVLCACRDGLRLAAFTRADLGELIGEAETQHG
jgi:hypothetical protein